MPEKIIDFHTHPFRSREYCLNFYPEMTALEPEGLKRQLAGAGITRICGSVLKRGGSISSFEDIRELNREALKLRELLGEFYTPGFHIHPAWPRESIAEIEAMQARGIRLIGELVPYMHGWGEFDSKSWMEIMDAADHYGMLCSYHTPFDFDMEEMLTAHPHVTFIAAHPGDAARVPEHIERMRRHENLCLDLSGTGLFRFGLLRHLIAEVGAERILFGTDYPICNPRMYVQAVFGEDISQEERDMVLWKNAERLFG